MLDGVGEEKQGLYLMVMHKIEAVGIHVQFNASCGQVTSLIVDDGGRQIEPYAKAPWRDAPSNDPRFPKDMPRHVKTLSGDFLCAPFGVDDVEGAPLHGWTANYEWKLLNQKKWDGGLAVCFELGKKVSGARVCKVLMVLDGHPFLYQRDYFIGGQGSISIAHHAMIDLGMGGKLTFSAKQFSETPNVALEPDPANGRSILKYPARSERLDSFPLANGGVSDLTRYPLDEGHEDFVMLVDEPGQKFGWALAERATMNDAAILVKSSQIFPVTMLWYSNNGRYYAPWNGEHGGVLGIEDACAYSGYGRDKSTRPNELSDAGIATSIDLSASPVTMVSYAIGALALPRDDARKTIKISKDELFVKGRFRRHVPLYSEFILGGDSFHINELI